MAITKKILSVALLGSTSVLAQMKPACSNHFYNKSSFEWSVYNADGQKTWIKISPNTTAPLTWKNTTSIVIRGEHPNKPFLQSFGMQLMNGCISIVPSGNSSEIILNNPKSGDVTTCAGGC